MAIADVIMRLPEKYRVLPVLLGAVLIHLALGTYHTFGNMLPYMSSYLRNRTDHTVTHEMLVWIPMMQGCFPFAMVVGGLISHRLGPRFTAALGCALMASGVFFSSFTITQSLWSFMMTYGFMYGLGQGIAYVTAVASVINWAPNKVGLVSGIVAAGFGFSSSIFAPFQTKMVNPWNYNPEHDGYFHQPELLDKVPHVFRLLGIIYAVMQSVGLIFICDPPGAPVDDSVLLYPLTSCFSPNRRARRASSFSTVRYSSLRSYDDAQPLTGKVRNRSQSRDTNGSSDAEESSDDGARKEVEKSMAPGEVLKSSTFYALFVALFCCSFYANTVYTLYKTFAEHFIEDDMFLATAFSLGSVCNAIARISWGLLTDKTSFQTALSLACSMASVLLLTMPLTAWGGRIVFLAWIMALFVCMAATHALFITAIVRCFGPKYKATNYGMVVFSTTMSGVLLSLVAQYSLKGLGYNWMFIITALFPFTAFGISTFIQLTPQGHRITG